MGQATRDSNARSVERIPDGNNTIPYHSGCLKHFKTQSTAVASGFTVRHSLEDIDHHNSFLGGPRPGRNVNNITWSDSRNALMIDPKTDLLVLYPSFRCRHRMYLYLFPGCFQKKTGPSHHNSLQTHYSQAAHPSWRSWNASLRRLSSVLVVAVSDPPERHPRWNVHMQKVFMVCILYIHDMIYASVWHIYRLTVSLPAELFLFSACFSYTDASSFGVTTDRLRLLSFSSFVRQITRMMRRWFLSHFISTSMKSLRTILWSGCPHSGGRLQGLVESAKRLQHIQLLCLHLIR